MMKYKNIYLYAFLLVISSYALAGCESFLDEVPDNRTELDSPEKVSELLVGAYPNASYFPIAEAMSDNATDLGPSNTSLIDINIAMYYWLDINLDERDMPIFYWNACYKAIAQANYALRAIDELGGGSELNPQRGEALVARAYVHFMLVNLWSKTYNPSSAATDLGVPYVTEPETEVIKDYKRVSVQEVYDLVEKDLLEGMKLIVDDYDEPKFHFTKTAANAFASRFYLIKGEWEKVIKYSSFVLARNPSGNLRDWNEYLPISFDDKRVRYQSSIEPANILLAGASSLHARNYASGRYGLSSALSGEIFDDHPLGKQWGYQVFNYSSTRYFVPKYDEYFEYTNLSAGIGQPYAMTVLFTHDEVLLNRMEAYVMLNRNDEAVTDINAFLSKKTRSYNHEEDILTYQELVDFYRPLIIEGEYNPFYEITNEQLPLLKFAIDSRQREFIHEGIRWFDNRRLGMEIIHADADGNEYVLTKDDPRRQLQIPQIAVSLGLEENPR